MKTRLLIIIVGIIIAGSVIFALTFEYSFEKEYYNIEIHGMKDSYHMGDEYSFYYTLSGFGHTCGAWTVYYPDKDGVIQHNGAVIDCTGITNNHLSYDSRQDGRKFTSFVPEISGKYNVTVSLENGASVVYTFTVLPKDNFDSSKYITVFDEGSPLQEAKTGNVVLTEDNCNRYAYWLTKYQKEKIDRYEDYPRYPPWGNEIFPLVNYCTDVGDLTKTVSEGNIQWKFELKNENKTSEVTGSYELDEAICIGGRGMIKNDKCERIGNYDIQTGIPIVENKVQCDLLNGTWYDDKNKCDSKYAPIEYRLQFGYSFLGYDVPQICTYDMMIHLARHSSMFENGAEYGIEDIGLPENINLDDYDICVDELLKLRSRQ